VDPEDLQALPATVQPETHSQPYVSVDYSPNCHPEASPPEPQHHPGFIHQIRKLVGSGEHLTLILDAILANSLEVTTDGSYNPITTHASCIGFSGEKTTLSIQDQVELLLRTETHIVQNYLVCWQLFTSSNT
jgi:hypothetical protein